MCLRFSPAERCDFLDTLLIDALRSTLVEAASNHLSPVRADSFYTPPRELAIIAAPEMAYLIAHSVRLYTFSARSLLSIGHPYIAFLQHRQSNEAISLLNHIDTMSTVYTPGLLREGEKWARLAHWYNHLLENVSIQSFFPLHWLSQTRHLDDSVDCAGDCVSFSVEELLPISCAHSLAGAQGPHRAAGTLLKDYVPEESRETVRDLQSLLLLNLPGILGQSKAGDGSTAQEPVKILSIARARIEYDPAIHAAVHAHWIMLTGHTETGSLSGHHSNPGPLLSGASYMYFLIHLSIVVLGEEHRPLFDLIDFSLNDVFSDCLVSSHFSGTAASMPSLTFYSFKRALLQLADNWTRSIHPAEWLHVLWNWYTLLYANATASAAADDQVVKSPQKNKGKAGKKDRRPRPSLFESSTLINERSLVAAFRDKYNKNSMTSSRIGRVVALDIDTSTDLLLAQAEPSDETDRHGNATRGGRSASGAVGDSIDAPSASSTTDDTIMTRDHDDGAKQTLGVEEKSGVVTPVPERVATFSDVTEKQPTTSEYDHQNDSERKGSNALATRAKDSWLGVIREEARGTKIEGQNLAQRIVEAGTYAELSENKQISKGDLMNLSLNTHIQRYTKYLNELYSREFRALPERVEMKTASDTGNQIDTTADSKKAQTLCPTRPHVLGLRRQQRGWGVRPAQPQPTIAHYTHQRSVINAVLAGFNPNSTPYNPYGNAQSLKNATADDSINYFQSIPFKLFDFSAVESVKTSL